MSKVEFELSQFIPYLLNQAAEATSKDFEKIYKIEFNITRPQWRIIANLGKHGAMSAKQVGNIVNQNKSSVSRAVFVLEEKGWLRRETIRSDRRSEELNLTATGRNVYKKLGLEAIKHNQELTQYIGHKDAAIFIEILERIIRKDDGN